MENVLGVVSNQENGICIHVIMYNVNNMISLPLELKAQIASNDQEVWFRIWLYDEDFRSRTHTEQFRKIFVNTFSTLKTDDYGVQTWWLLEKRHRENDQPAVVYPNGGQAWWRRGERHRGVTSYPPAISLRDGTQEWWVNGKRHRGGNEPAVIFVDGYKEWWKNGKCHRGVTSYPPAVIDADGSQEWWVNGQRGNLLPACCDFCRWI